MKNKLGYLISSLIMVVTLSGCQLAREDLATTKEQDKLIGVYITYESLDLFDMDRYLQDNFEKLSKGENVQMNQSQNNNEYHNRLYATLVEKEMTDEKGNQYIDSEYVFDGLEGLAMFSYESNDPISGDGYSINTSNDGILELTMSVLIGDQEEGMELAGTLYVQTGAELTTLYLNPVYQNEDHQIYLLSGQGTTFGGESLEGSEYKTTITNSMTVTENKEIKTYNTTIILSIATVYPSEKIVVFQMDSDNNMISKNEYLTNTIPEEIIPDESCEYFLVENFKIDMEGELLVERQLFSKQEESIFCFSKGEHDILTKKYSSIKW